MNAGGETTTDAAVLARLIGDERIAELTHTAVQALRGVRAALDQRDDVVLIDPSLRDLLGSIQKIPELVELMQDIVGLLSGHLHATRQRQCMDPALDTECGKMVVALDGLSTELDGTEWQRIALRRGVSHVRGQPQ